MRLLLPELRSPDAGLVRWRDPELRSESIADWRDARTREDFPRLVDLYLAGKLPLDGLITRRYGIDETNEAFRDLAAGALARGLIVF